jgi:SET domain-containing protein
MRDRQQPAFPMTRRIVQRRSPIHGNGVFAAADLPADIELVEYRGRLLTHAQADRKYAGGSDTGHTFLFTLNDRYIIDANVDGNVARWINHSCAPNCQATVEESEDGNPRHDRVLIETLRPIRKGEELTYDYGITLDERLTPRLKRIWACRCGAPNCIGTMLKPKRKRAASR